MRSSPLSESCEELEVRRVNLHTLGRRLRGHATCIMGQSARLGSHARIFNMTGDDRRITIGAHSIILGELLVYAHGGMIECGEWCFVGDGTRIWSGARVSIGNRVLISHGVNIIDGLTHPLDPLARHAHFREIAQRGHPSHISLGDRPIRFDDDSWVGAGAIILRGTTIGEGAIVGAGAVVTKDVPPYTVVVGNPARIARTIAREE